MAILSRAIVGRPVKGLLAVLERIEQTRETGFYETPWPD